jgi:hypothetical protein
MQFAGGGQDGAGGVPPGRGAREKAAVSGPFPPEIRAFGTSALYGEAERW